MSSPEDFEFFEQFVVEQFPTIQDIPAAPNGRFDVDYIFGGRGEQENALIDPNLIAGPPNGDQGAFVPAAWIAPAVPVMTQPMYGNGFGNAFAPYNAFGPNLHGETASVNPFNIRGSGAFTIHDPNARSHSISPPYPTSYSSDPHTPATVNPSQILGSPPPIVAIKESPETDSLHLTESSYSPSPPPPPAPRTRSGRQSAVSRGKARASEPYRDAAAATTSRRARKDLQDGDIVRGWACPYKAHKGSPMHCNVLLGTIHEIPRHMLKHLIEEEDTLRKNPGLDPTTLIFGGAPSHRPVCPICGEVFSRHDAWDRHVKRQAERGGECSIPVGMHGRHAKLETFKTNGAAEVLATIKVTGEKRFIEKIHEVYSTWSNKYRFKNVRGGKEKHPEWFTNDELSRRGARTAYTRWTE